MYVVGVLAFSEDVMGDVTEIRLSLERLGYTAHLEQMGYNLRSNEIGMFEDDSLLFQLGRCYSNTERCREIAETFVRQGVDLILAMKTPAVEMAVAASEDTGIPIIFTHVNHLEMARFISDAEKPGGRISGVRDISQGVTEERLALFQQVVPAPTIVHAFYNPGLPDSKEEAQALIRSAESLNIQLSLHPYQDVEDVRRELIIMRIHQDYALLCTSDPILGKVSGLMGATAREKYIPYAGMRLEEMERCGALFTLDQRGIGSQAALLIHRVIKGEDPGMIPVVEPERRVLGVNLQAAQDLGLVVAPSVLERAQAVVHERERTSLGARLFLVLFLVAFSLVLTVSIASQYGGRTLILAGMMAVVVDALTLWVYLNHHIIRPIRELTMAAEKIGVGNLDVEIGEVHVEDEIGVLGRAFRRMRSNIKYSQTELERVNANLEEQIKEKTEALQRMQDLQQEIELSNRRIIDADDNSRFALTTYIHDEILVPLDELNARARACGDKTMADLAIQVDRRLRRVRFDLSVPIIQDMRVELRRLLQEILPQVYPEARRVRLSLDLAALNWVEDLEPACSMLLYRFVQGAASNAFRHAQAQRLWVKAFCEDGRLNLRVSDDGIGFNPQQIDQYISLGHYFFHDIHIRARQLGGELRIQSEPGKGTLLEITIPVMKAGLSPDSKEGIPPGGKGYIRKRR